MNIDKTALLYLRLLWPLDCLKLPARLMHVLRVNKKFTHMIDFVIISQHDVPQFIAGEDLSAGESIKNIMEALERIGATLDMRIDCGKLKEIVLPLLSRPVADLALSEDLKRLLIGEKIFFCIELVQWTSNEMLRISGMNNDLLEELEKKLALNGLSLDMKVDWILDK